MQKNIKTVVLLGNILLCATTVAAAHTGSLVLSAPESQRNDSTDRRHRLEELVVMPFKQEKDLSLSPIATSTFNAGMIKNRNITDIKDISAAVPNLFVPDYGSRLTSPVYIRGIGSKINFPSVDLYVDDMPYF